LKQKEKLVGKKRTLPKKETTNLSEEQDASESLDDLLGMSNDESSISGISDNESTNN
jgi:hypothetical protein